MIERVELSIPIFSRQKKTQKIVKLFQALQYRDLVQDLTSQLATSEPYGWSFPQDASPSCPFPSSSFALSPSFHLLFHFLSSFFLPLTRQVLSFLFYPFPLSSLVFSDYLQAERRRGGIPFLCCSPETVHDIISSCFMLAWETLCTLLQPDENIT